MTQVVVVESSCKKYGEQGWDKKTCDDCLNNSLQIWQHCYDETRRRLAIPKCRGSYGKTMPDGYKPDPYSCSICLITKDCIHDTEMKDREEERQRRARAKEGQAGAAEDIVKEKP